MHNDIFLLKTSEGGGGETWYLFIVLITSNKRNKDQFGKQRGFKQNNLWCQDFVVFLKKFHDPFALQRTIKK